MGSRMRKLALLKRVYKVQWLGIFCGILRREWTATYGKLFELLPDFRRHTCVGVPKRSVQQRIKPTNPVPRTHLGPCRRFSLRSILRFGNYD